MGLPLFVVGRLLFVAMLLFVARGRVSFAHVSWCLTFVDCCLSVGVACRCAKCLVYWLHIVIVRYVFVCCCLVLEVCCLGFDVRGSSFAVAVCCFNV